MNIFTLVSLSLHLGHEGKFCLVVVVEWKKIENVKRIKNKFVLFETPLFHKAKILRTTWGRNLII